MSAAPKVSPTVSVIIAAYEASGFVGGAIASALGQSLETIEVILVDDASRDDTIGAAKDAAGGDPRLTCLKLETNGGPAAARNAALAVATGDWIAVLDADDAMEPGRLEALVAFAEAEGADVAADMLLAIEDGRADAVLRPRRLPSPLTLAVFAHDNTVAGGGGRLGYLKPIFRRAFLDAHGIVYDESLRIGEDWTLAADALAFGARYVLLDRPLYRYALRAGSISHRFTVDALTRLIAAADAFATRHAGRLDAETRDALAMRRKGLADLLAFQRFIDCAKARRPVAALAALAARPSAWPLVRLPIMARLAGRRGERALMG